MIAPRVLVGTGTSSSPSTSRAVGACAIAHGSAARYGARHTRGRGLQRSRWQIADRATFGGPECRTRVDDHTGAVPADPVVVVGAGPVGLTAALLLPARGLRCASSSGTGRRIPCPAPSTWTTRCSACCRRPGWPTRCSRGVARWRGCGCSTAGTGSWPSSAGRRTPDCTAGRRAPSCTSPTSRRCCRSAADADPGVTVERGVEVTACGPDAVGVTLRGPARRRCGPFRPRIRGPRLRRRQQHRPLADRRDDARPRAGRPVAGARRPVGRSAAGVAGRPPGVRPAPAGDVHAGHRGSVPLGVPDGAGGDGGRPDDAGVPGCSCWRRSTPARSSSSAPSSTRSGRRSPTAGGPAGCCWPGTRRT